MISYFNLWSFLITGKIEFAGVVVYPKNVSDENDYCDIVK